ncbi:MAG: nicotinamide-nucleotide amidohydrolase family protein [Myxococcota bacterium]
MSIALLSIGDELLRGEIINTNAQWLGEELTTLGGDVSAVEAVGDDVGRIAEAILRLGKTHEVVVATGGLGPTTDDCTAEAVATALSRPLEKSDGAREAIARRLSERGRDMLAGHEKQAWFPRGATVLANPVGTAPGFALGVGDPGKGDDRGGTPAKAASSEEGLGFALYVLPGVPREMKAMFDRHLREALIGAMDHDHHDAFLHTFGVGESWVAQQLEGIGDAHPEVSLGFRASDGIVAVRISARTPAGGDARRRVQDAAGAIRERLGTAIFGEDAQSLPQLAGKVCRARGWRLAVAESCTGGLIARRLTREPASDFFVGGAVTYANAAKTKLLGVSEDTLRGHGAVSAEVAAEMAEGARRAFDCDVAISVTGIAGPSGATADKPLGLVHWAVSTPDGTTCEHRVFAGDRNQVQRHAANASLDLLRRALTAPRPSRPSRR